MHSKRLLFASLFLFLPLLAGAQKQKPAPQGKNSVSQSITSQVPPTNVVVDLSGKTQLDAGKTLNLVRIDGKAQVMALQMKITPNDRYSLRQTLIRIYWDDAKTPAVEVPLGDFFGIPFGVISFESGYFTNKETGSIAAIPIVFHKNMRVELANRGKTPLTNIQWKLSYQRLKSLPPNALYFHAQWTRRTSEPNKSFTTADIRGVGYVQGLSVALQNEKPDLPALIANTTQIRVTANNTAPYLNANLSQFFMLSNLAQRNVRAAPLNGSPLIEQTLGRMHVYRWFEYPSISFTQNLQIEMSFPAKVDVAATVYWYQTTPTHAAEPLKTADLTPARLRLPNVIEAEALAWDGGNPTPIEDRGFKSEASGGKVMEFAKETTIATFPVTAEDVYILNIAAFLRPGATLKYRYALDDEDFSDLTVASIAPLEAENIALWITSVPMHLKTGMHKIKIQPLGDKPLFLDYLELFPSRKVDGAVEVENLIDAVKVTEGSSLTRDNDDPAFSGNSFLRWDKVPLNAELSVPLDIPQDGDYTLDVGILRDTDCPILTVKLDGKEIGEVDTFISNRDIDVQPLRAGTIMGATAGKHTLTLVVKEIHLGKSQCTLNFDYTKIKRVSQ